MSDVESEFATAARLERTGDWASAIAIYDSLATRLNANQESIYATNCAIRLRDLQLLGNSSSECQLLRSELLAAESNLAKQSEKLFMAEERAFGTVSLWPYNVLGLVILLLLLWMLNPSDRSFSNGYKARLAESRNDRGLSLIEEVAAAALAEFALDYEVNNCQVFSIGRVFVKGDHRFEVHVLGFLGRWWYEWVDLPRLYLIPACAVGVIIGALINAVFKQLASIVWKVRWNYFGERSRRMHPPIDIDVSLKNRLILIDALYIASCLATFWAVFYTGMLYFFDSDSEIGNAAMHGAFVVAAPVTACLCGWSFSVGWRFISFGKRAAQQSHAPGLAAGSVSNGESSRPAR